MMRADNRSDSYIRQNALNRLVVPRAMIPQLALLLTHLPLEISKAFTLATAIHGPVTLKPQDGVVHILGIAMQITSVIIRE